MAPDSQTTKSLRLWSTIAGILPFGLIFVYSALSVPLKVVGEYHRLYAPRSGNSKNATRSPIPILRMHGRFSIRLDRGRGCKE